jgi:hypothetical protein
VLTSRISAMASDQVDQLAVRRKWSQLFGCCAGAGCIGMFSVVRFTLESAESGIVAV